MNILGREFVAEQMPGGWVICEKWIDGALNLIDNNPSNRKNAHLKLQHLSDCLVKDCQKSGATPEQYWQMHNDNALARLMYKLKPSECSL